MPEVDGKFRLLITITHDSSNGGAAMTSTVVGFDTREEADAVYQESYIKMSIKMLKLYSKEES